MIQVLLHDLVTICATKHKSYLKHLRCLVNFYIVYF